MGWVGRSVLAATLALALAACGSPEERAAAYAARAEQQLAVGDTVAARMSALEAIGERDDDPRIWGLLGRIEVAAGSYGAAFNAYSRANELDRGNLEALQLVMEISFLARRLDDAARYSDELLSLQPGNARALLVRGGVALQRRDAEAAIAAADAVLAQTPSNEEARVLRARALLADGRQDEAIDWMNAELARFGDSAASVRQLLDVRRLADDGDGVLDAYRRLVALDPADIAPRLDYAEELYRRGRDAEAFEQTEAVRLANREDEGAMQRILALWLETGRAPVRPEQVAAIIAEGTQAERLAMARYAVESGRPADVAAMLAPLLGQERIGYDNVEAQVLLAMAEHGLGRTADARQRVERIHEFDPSNPRALALRARLRMEAGELEAALVDAQILARDDPASVEARRLIADIYTRRRDLALAERSYVQAMRQIPGQPALAEAYADFLLARDRPAEAVQMAEAFTRGFPGDPRGWRLLGRLCGQTRDAACVSDSRSALAAIAAGNLA